MKKEIKLSIRDKILAVYAFYYWYVKAVAYNFGKKIGYFDESYYITYSYI